MSESIKELAKLVDDGAHNAKAIEQLSNHHPITLSQAYDIQKASIDRRLDRGEKLVGLKMGFTSKAKMEQMGVHELIWGRLTDQMQIHSGETLTLEKFIHPRAEPEIAFLIAEDVPEGQDLASIGNYIESVAPAIEIIDSRYKNFKFSLEDVVADNCSSAGFVLGEWSPFTGDLRDLCIDLIINKECKHEGSSNAILGNPLLSLLDAVKLGFKYNEPVKKGMIILAGAATPAEYIQLGDHIETNVDRLGNVSLTVV